MRDARWAVNVNTVFTAAKLLALVVIVLGGIGSLAQGKDM